MYEDGAAQPLVHHASGLQARGGRQEFTVFDDSSVNAIAQGIQALWSMHERDLGNPHINVRDPFYATRLRILRAQALHDKRCLCSYLKSRLDHVTASWWGMLGKDEHTHGAISQEAPSSPVSSSEPSARGAIPHDLLNPSEGQFLRNYGNLMVSYMTALGNLDLRMCASGHIPGVQRYVVLTGKKTFVGVSAVTGRTLQIYPGKCLSLTYEDAAPLLSSGVVVAHGSE